MYLFWNSVFASTQEWIFGFLPWISSLTSLRWIGTKGSIQNETIRDDEAHWKRPGGLKFSPSTQSPVLPKNIDLTSSHTTHITWLFFFFFHCCRRIIWTLSSIKLGDPKWDLKIMEWLVVIGSHNNHLWTCTCRTEARENKGNSFSCDFWQNPLRKR